MFKKNACEEPLYVGLMGSSGDTLSMISHYLKSTPVAVYLDERPVKHGAIWQFLVINITEIATEIVHGHNPVLHPLIVVSRPANAAKECLWPASG